MDLLEKASVILTPTAYNNGEALCVKPSDGSGDFDFSRNSAATRVNAQGLVENVQILSSNLVQNGDFSEEGVQEVSNGSFSQEGVELVTNGDFANWTNDNPDNYIVLNENANNYVTEANGQLRMVSDNSATIAIRPEPTNMLTIGKFYKVSVDLTFTTGTIDISGVSFNTSGTKVFYLTAPASYLQISKSSALDVLIDNVSVREVGQDWTLGTGWSIGEDKAICDGTQTTQSTLQTTNNLSLGVGKVFKISFDITDYSSGSLALTLVGTGGLEFDNINANGSYVGYSNNPSTGNAQLQVLADANFIGSITNISVKEVGMDWTLDDWSVGNSLVSSGNTSSLLRQDNIYTSTTSIYKTTFKAKSVNGTSVTLRVYDGSGNNFETITITSSEFQDFTLTRQRQGASPSLFFYNNSNAEIEITNISVIEITDDTNLPRISYEGFSYQDALGSELVTNGDFATDSDWAKGTGWTISGGTANTDGTPSSQIRQNNVTTVGKQYKYSFTISNSGGGVIDARFRNKSTGAPILNFSNEGTYSGTFTSNGTFIDFVTLSNNTASFSIDNVSVKEYLGQEVVPNSGCGSWLFEPQTTQIVSYSELFSNAAWTNEGIGTTPILETGFLAPDGTNNAFKISNANQDSFLYAITGGLVATSTRSIYARTVSGTGTAQLCSHNSNTNNIFTITEQWQRFDVNAVTSSIGQISFYAVDFRGVGTLSELIIWGANATNDQDYVTSYIPTNGEANGVTRNQDVCTNGGSLATINSTEGVLYAEIAALSDDGTFRLISLSDGTNNNTVKIGYRSNSNAIYFEVKSGGAGQAFYIYTTTDITDFSKVAVSYKLNDFSLWVDGVKRYNDTTGNTPIGLNTLSFNRGDLFQDFFGKTKALAVWKEALSDSELQSLTTI